MASILFFPWVANSMKASSPSNELVMPLLTLDITCAPLTPARRRLIQQGLTDLMASELGKVRRLTVVHVRESPDRSAWTVDGQPLADTDWCASLNVAITDGTNTEAQQGRFLAAAHRLLEDALGQAPAAPLYIVVQNLPAAHWGYGGRTQASRRLDRPDTASDSA